MSTDWIGLTCECFLGGELVRMDVYNLSHGGFFAETTVPLELGQELSARLVGGAASRPVHVRAVVESRVRRGESGSENRPGVRLRLLRFSWEYSALLSGDSSKGRVSDPSQNTHQPIRAREDEGWLTSILEEKGEASPVKRVEEREWPEWEEYEPLSERAGVPLWSDESPPPKATVIDDGELDDVVRVLAELGVKADRPSPDEDSLSTNWIPPRHLLVVTAKRALMLGLPLRSLGQRFVSIAVSDSDARMVSSSVRSLGYQYVINRPVHPMALSMLIRQAIVPHREQRTSPREVRGCPVRWRCGWARKRPGVMLEVSMSGCQLLVRDVVAKGSRIKIRVPDGVAGGRAFTLVGQITRSDRGVRETTLGVSFDGLSAKVQERLQDVLALHGPCRLTEELLLREGESTASQPRDDVLHSPQKERRQKTRAEIRKEVVALEHDSSQIKHVLVSSNLNVDGMHVEPHPSVVMGEQVDLAIYEESERAALILSAVATRDDGRKGWWLRFVGVTPEIHERLTQIVGCYSPIECLDRPDSELARVILSQMLVQEKSPEEDELT